MRHLAYGFEMKKKKKIFKRIAPMPLEVVTDFLNTFILATFLV